MKAFGNNKRNVSASERISELKAVTQYKFAKELASSRCNYVNNNTVNRDFTVDYGYTSDSLVGSIRNVSSYSTLLQLSKGHNICTCETTEYNTTAELTEAQSYSYQDLSGIILFDTCGNKLFDDAFFNMCNDIDYTTYEAAMTGEKRLVNKNTFLNNFNYPKKIQLMSEYAKPEFLLYGAIPTTNYLIKLENIIIKTDVDNCLETSIVVDLVKIKLFKRIVTNTVITATDVIKTYANEEQDVITGIMSGDLTSTPTSELVNSFTNIAINKPGINYFFSFTNPDVPDICSNYFNVYGQFKRFVAPGLYNTEIENTIFTDTETINQGATSGRVTFAPTISGDYFYQSQYNNNVFGQINIEDSSSGHIDISNYYIISLKQGFPSPNYFITVSGETTSANSPTLTAYTGDTLIFDICQNQTFTKHPLYIQLEQGAPINTTEVEDASGIIGIANQVITTISMEIMDIYSNKFNAADNEVRIRIDGANNNNNATLTGTTVKNATAGELIFDDLIINHPGTEYKFLIFTNDGEIIQTLTPKFSILGNLIFITKNDVRQYIVGEDISNLGVRMENADFDNSTDIHTTLNNGTLQTNTSYTTPLDISMSGNHIVTLSGGDMYTDVSINKIGSNYTFVFDASNAATPVTSEPFNIVGILDLSNSISVNEYSSLQFKSGTDLSNYLLELHDICSNIIPLNADVIINILTYDASDNTGSLRETHTANMIDGSLNLSNISINTTGFNYFIEISMNEANTNKTTGLIDVNADIDISAQPFKYADRIFGQDLHPFTAKVINTQNEPLQQDLSLAADFVQAQQGVIMQGDSTVDTSGGYAIFSDIDLLDVTPITESKHNINVIVEGRDPSDNLNSFTTDSFTILYTNWNNSSKDRVAPGITSVPTTDHLVYADVTYLPFDSSYVIIKGADPSNNSPHWKANTTAHAGDYIRTMAWDISYQENAGAIFRIQRKLYTEDVSNDQYNADADFSLIPLYEIEASAAEGRSPYTYYYDYSFNSTQMPRVDHSNNSILMRFDTAIYDSSWTFTTFRSQLETDIVAEKLKVDAINITDVSENCDYFIAGKMDICSNVDPDYNHILYSWDVSGERNHYIWVGPKSKID